MHEHYNQSYFEWQKDMGAFGGWANLIKFEKFITSDMNVLDFGCGGGYLLNNIKCKDKIGIEINDEARKTIDDFGIRSYKYVQEVPNNWADCIISDNALEHVPDPLYQLYLLKEKLKAGGKIIFVVPCESIKYKYKPDNINYHLFSWSPMNLGNLFTEAGYKIIESKAYYYKWPPHYNRISKIFGKRFFYLLCKIYAHIESSWFQVRIIAKKNKL